MQVKFCMKVVQTASKISPSPVNDWTSLPDLFHSNFRPTIHSSSTTDGQSTSAFPVVGQTVRTACRRYSSGFGDLESRLISSITAAHIILVGKTVSHSMLFENYWGKVRFWNILKLFVYKFGFSFAADSQWRTKIGLEPEMLNLQNSKNLKFVLKFNNYIILKIN